MLLGVICLVEVDAESDGYVRFLRGRRDDHLARACLEMLRGARAGAEPAGRFDHDLDAELRQGSAAGSEIEGASIRRPSTISAPSVASTTPGNGP